jgi:hypothetical protein
MANARKELQAILDELERQHFTVRRTTRGHFQVKDPTGRIVSVFPGTASDSKSLRNSLADCKRAGFKWPPPGKR